MSSIFLIWRSVERSVSHIAFAAISIGNAVLLQPAPEPVKQSSCNEGALWWTWVENACKIKKFPIFPQGPWTPKNTCKKLTCVTFYYLVYVRTHNLCYQRKLGSNTSELRMTFTMMKGGARSILDGIDYDEGWCAIYTGWNWLWWRVVRDLYLMELTMMKGGAWSNDLTIHDKRIRSDGIDYDEGWCVI